jgi:uncharacterized RDD family membrane protein YckC
MSSLSQSLFGLWLLVAGFVILLVAVSLVCRPLRTLGREPRPPGRPVAATLGWRRAFAAAIDASALYLLYMPIGPGISQMTLTGITPELREAGYAPGSVEETMARLLFLILVSAVAWCVLSIPYRTLLEGWLGATPGKLLLGLRVRSFAGGRIGGYPGIHRAFVRTLLRPVDGLPAFYALGWFVALLSPVRRRTGDYLAGTVVVAPERAAVPRLHPPEAEIDARRRAVGERAEEAVYAALEPLTDEGFYLFRGVPHRYFGDVDNVLVGPTGVFAVESKGHKGRIGYDPAGMQLLRNGLPLERDVYTQVAKQVEHLEDSLRRAGFPVEVDPLICFPRAELVCNTFGERSPHTCSPREAVEYALHADSVHSPQEVDAMAGAICGAYGVSPAAMPRYRPEPLA